ncbi:MAG: tetratricopeptide repeat protein [Candidatus Hermodarchaeota archaeon]
MLEETENYYKIAKNHIKNKAYEDALNVLKMALNLDSESPLLTITLAYTHTLLDFKEMSESEVRDLEKKAVSLDKKSAQVWKYLGLINIHKNEYDKAINCYNKSIDLDSSRADLWYRLGEAFFKKNKLHKAFDAFKKATELQSTLFKAWSSIGDIYANRKEIDKAINAYKKIIDSISKMDLQKETAHGKKDLIEIQIESYQKIVSLDPYDVDSWEQIGKLYEEIEDYDKAIEFFEKATEVAPYDTDLWIEIGNTYYLRKKYKAAIKFYEKAINIAPDKVRPNIDKIPVVKSYKKLIEANPENAQLWINLGYIHEYKKEKEKALNCYENALQIDPNNALARMKYFDIKL